MLGDVDWLESRVGDLEVLYGCDKFSFTFERSGEREKPRLEFDDDRCSHRRALSMVRKLFESFNVEEMEIEVENSQLAYIYLEVAEGGREISLSSGCFAEPQLSVSSEKPERKAVKSVVDTVNKIVSEHGFTTCWENFTNRMVDALFDVFERFKSSLPCEAKRFDINIEKDIVTINAMLTDTISSYTVNLWENAGEHIRTLDAKKFKKAVELDKALKNRGFRYSISIYSDSVSLHAEDIGISIDASDYGGIDYKVELGDLKRVEEVIRTFDKVLGTKVWDDVEKAVSDVLPGIRDAVEKRILPYVKRPAKYVLVDRGTTVKGIYIEESEVDVFFDVGGLDVDYSIAEAVAKAEPETAVISDGRKKYYDSLPEISLKFADNLEFVVEKTPGGYAVKPRETYWISEPSNLPTVETVKRTIEELSKAFEGVASLEQVKKVYTVPDVVVNGKKCPVVRFAVFGKNSVAVCDYLGGDIAIVFPAGSRRIEITSKRPLPRKFLLYLDRGVYTTGRDWCFLLSAKVN